MKVNFGNVAKNYARFRNDLPDELLESLKLRGIVFDGKKVADLGCGTGVFCRALYREGDRIEYKNNFSEDTSLLDNTYDFITVLRAWHWFDSEKTLTEIKRLLKDNGSLIIMDSGFISKNKVVEDTIKFIREYMPNGKLKPAGSKSKSSQLINSFPVEWFKEWQENQFDLKETYKFSYNVTFSNEEWCGRVGSLSWLSSFNEIERNNILENLHIYLNQAYGEIEHNIKHGCYVAILNRI